MTEEGLVLAEPEKDTEKEKILGLQQWPANKFIICFSFKLLFLLCTTHQATKKCFSMKVKCMKFLSIDPLKMTHWTFKHTTLYKNIS